MDGMDLLLVVRFSSVSCYYKELSAFAHQSADVLDGAMLVICLYSFNVFYPGRLLVPDYGSTQTVTSEDNIDLVPTYRFNA